MPRVTHVKRAQARYKTVPVLNEDGTPKRTPVMRTRTDRDTGETVTTQRTTKKGKPVTMAVTTQDKDQPLPMPQCDFPGCKHEDRTIKVGQPYKHITPKSGPYGGRTRSRHEDCPTWEPWEYSSSLSARTAQIVHEGWESFPEDATEVGEYEGWAEDVAAQIEDLAEEKDESARNIEEGFGHSTSASEDLAQVAEDLRGWAETVRSIDWPDLDEECDHCNGTGKAAEGVEADADTDPEEDCSHCDGSGEDDDKIEAWRDECRDAAAEMDEVPV